MADLTIGEVGNIIQLNLVNIDTSQAPPVQSALNLSGATQVQLSFVICDQASKPLTPAQSRNMVITNAPGGVVQYTFVAADLVRPPAMGKYGIFRYSVKVTFNTGVILFSAFDGKLTVKDDSVL